MSKPPLPPDDNAAKTFLSRLWSLIEQAQALAEQPGALEGLDELQRRLEEACRLVQKWRAEHP